MISSLYDFLDNMIVDPMTPNPSANSNTMVRLRYQHRGHVRIDLIDGCTNDDDRVHIVRLTMPIQMFVKLLQLLSTSVDDQHLFNRVRDQLVTGDHHHILLKIRVYSPASIDYAWDERMSAIVQRNLELERQMWNMSTLGGAFSAMGDYYLYFAQRANILSIEQLQIAQRIGDPVLIARCKLYIALSLAQQGRFGVAKAIVRQQYRAGRDSIASDLIVSCSIGVWNKLRAIRLERLHHVASVR